MNLPVNILVVEDSEDDVRLALRALRRGGFDPTHRRVQTASELQTALLDELWDAVIADFKLPRFNGMDALNMVRASGLDIPFILVSCTIGEENAVLVMKAGASDYVMKGNLARLAPALARELKEAQRRADHRLAQEALTESEDRFRQLAENIRDVFFLMNADATRMVYISPAYEEIWGRSCASLYANPESWTGAIHPDDRASASEKYRLGLSSGKTEFDFRIVRPDGSIRWVEIRTFPVRDEAGTIVRIAGVAADVTERKRSEAEAQTRSRAMEQSPASILITDRAGAIEYVNPRFEQVTGYTSAEVVGKNPRILKSGKNTPEVYKQMWAAISVGDEWRGQLCNRRKSGELFWEYAAISGVRSEDGQIEHYIAVKEDISESKAAAERIVRLNRILATLSGINALIVRVHDRDELLREACRIAVEDGQFQTAWVGVVDWKAMELIPVSTASKSGDYGGYLASTRERLSLRDGAPAGRAAAVLAVREKRAVVRNDVAADPPGGHKDALLDRGIRSVASLPLFIGDEPVAVLCLHAPEAEFFDEAEMKLLNDLGGDLSFALDHIAKEKRLNYLAYYDVLTELPNRSLLYDRMKQGMRTAQRNESLLAVLLVDLDNFKTVNDTLGHTIGDALLQEVARRLASCLRDTDTVGRLGGDEFGIILPEIGSGEDAAMVARKVIESCAKPHLIDGHELFVSASVGITLFPDDAVDVETLVRNADTAMYRAKELGRNTYQFFTAEMNQSTQDKMRLETDLRRALAAGEFLLHYQPKVSCATGKVTGFEALLRWQHPQRGLVGPIEFIPLLEDTGMIVPVGEWVLEAACTQARRWHDEGLGTPSMAVNISGRQILLADLCETVRVALATSGLTPAHLELELTESQLMNDAEGIIGLLRRLKAMGVSLTVDDFGTGYSSLAYLKRFPIDSLKVDQSFVRDIIADPSDVSITRAIITLAHSLKLKVVAEGVETEGQLGLLIANHCDEIQGYYFARPLPAEEATALLRSGRSLDSRMLVGLKRSRTLLLVDDEENILSALKRLLRRDGYTILSASGAEQGLELLAIHPVDVIVSDQRMPGMSGVEFLRRAKTIHPETVRMVLSGYTDLQAVTDAINEGSIYKFLTKPWDDGILRANIEEAFRNKEMADENRRLHSEVGVANSQMAMVNQQLQKLLASSDLQVMRGETVLDIAQEVLQQLPWPVIGIDEERMIALANEAADALCGDGAPLLGRTIDSFLPAQLIDALGSLLTSEADIDINGARYHLRWNTMGEHSRSRGTLLVLLPKEAAP